MVNDGDGHVYMHQAKYNDGTKHYMFRYDFETGNWDSLKGMPLAGLDGGKLKNKKSKDGATGAWYDGKLYALKGGNTQTFYHYEPAPADSWIEDDTIPSVGTTAKKKKVKAGSDMVQLGEGTFYALKGNKTYEFWRYNVGVGLAAPRPDRSGVMANPSTISDLRVTTSPNPISSSFARLSYSLPKAGPVVVSVFDVAGRTVTRQSLLCGKTGSVPLDLKKLANGVYLVRLDADGYSQSQKLVVQQ